jgi:hypothetical protein
MAPIPTSARYMRTSDRENLRAAIPTGFQKLPHVAKMGDVGLATDRSSGRTTEFIVADAGGGSDAKLGEA